MASLWTLFSRRPRPQTYARLDTEGNCTAFKQCQQAPGGSEWVLVNEANLGWLGRPLPRSARVCNVAKRRWQQRLLAV